MIPDVMCPLLFTLVAFSLVRKGLVCMVTTIYKNMWCTATSLSKTAEFVTGRQSFFLEAVGDSRR